VRLSIRHTTTYRFSRQVTFNPHRLMLRPRSDLNLHVLSHNLTIRPHAELDWSTDMFDNLVATAVFSGTASDVVFDSHLVLENTAPEWPVYPIAPRAQQHPFEYTADERIDLAGLRSAGAGDQSVAAWTKELVAQRPTDTLSLLIGLNTQVRDALAYEVRVEENTQPAAETLRRRAGACRDYAELFLASARFLGFAARAVSGYLVDAERTGGGDATHAWAEIYLPGPGWIAFDPTNGRMGTAGLVKVASARTSAQALPIVGSYVGEARDHLSLEVLVRTEEGVPGVATW